MDSNPATNSATEQCDATPLDRCANRIEQAHALIVHACGVGGESFRMLADTIQDAYLFAVAEVLSAALSDARAIPYAAPALTSRAPADSESGDRFEAAAIAARADAVGYRIGTPEQGGDVPIDRLTMRISHARALVTHACAAGGECFRGLSEAMQDDYLCAVMLTLSAAMADAAVLERMAMQRAPATFGPMTASAH